MSWIKARYGAYILIIVFVLAPLITPLEATAEHLDTHNVHRENSGGLGPNSVGDHGKSVPPVIKPKNPFKLGFPLNISLYGGKVTLTVSKNRIQVMSESYNVLTIEDVLLLDYSREMHFLGFIGKGPHDVITVKVFPVLMVVGFVKHTNVTINLMKIESHIGSRVVGYSGSLRAIIISDEIRFISHTTMTVSGRFMITLMTGNIGKNVIKYVDTIRALSERVAAYAIIKRMHNRPEIESFAQWMNISMKLIKVEPNRRIIVRVSSEEHLRNPIIVLEIGNISKRISMVLLDEMPLVRAKSVSELESTPGSYYVIESYQGTKAVAVHIPHMSTRTIVILFEELYKKYSVYGTITGVLVGVILLGVLFYSITRED
ncbi:MAG: hypothetical protein DRN26_01035 [Thermoplasmata archaeon]|nr:MAG: hypothetical protein DRN26_01035 [Thermoplasmata archaeon]